MIQSNLNYKMTTRGAALNMDGFPFKKLNTLPESVETKKQELGENKKSLFSISTRRDTY